MGHPPAVFIIPAFLDVLQTGYSSHYGLNNKPFIAQVSSNRQLVSTFHFMETQPDDLWVDLSQRLSPIKRSQSTMGEGKMGLFSKSARFLSFHA